MDRRSGPTIHII